ncbi:MAG: tryptophan synthase subunit alpha [Christensenella sp.]
MTKINQKLKKAFIPFLTAGDPCMEITEELIVGMAAAGAAMIEIGVPFSDPVAEGETIAHADKRALLAGTTADSIFEMVSRVRAKTDVPLVLLSYANSIFTYGSDRFVRKCAELGISALIVQDLPFEEKDELQPFCTKHGVNLVSLIAPTAKERVQKIARGAEGFLYCVPPIGAEGANTEIAADMKKMIAEIREQSDIACVVGLAYRTPEQAAEAVREADGVIADVAVMEIVAEHGRGCVPYVMKYVQEMIEMIREIKN